ncbi:MAG: hypothetical protein AAF499_03875 [Pseudomonadota bacterium]
MTDFTPVVLRTHSVAAITYSFLPYLALQAFVLLLWWPKSSLFERIGNVDEPATLTVVVVSSGAALACYALLMDIYPPRTPPLGNSARYDQALASEPNSVTGYAATQIVQLGYLMMLCLPLTLIAHAVSSLATTQLLWIALFTAVHTVFYRLLGIWFCLRWPAREMLLQLGCPALLVLGYALTTYFSPCLSHAGLSYYVTAPGREPPLSQCGPIFVGSYAVLAVLLCLDGLRLLRQRMQQRSEDSTAQP